MRMIVAIVAGLMLAGCAAHTAEQVRLDRPEAWSLLGRPLARPEFTPERRLQLATDLTAAAGAYEQDPASEDAIIWLGRRQAYLGRYNDAIATFSRGLERHPDSAKLLRHRGHRYITVRRFDEAASDLARAARLIEGKPDEAEPDGAPNARNIPRSTLHTNVWYHLALARYLRGEFAEAASAWRRCLELSPNDDMRVAAANWLYVSLRRAGKGDEAAKVLAGITPDMDVIENTAYLRLLMMHKGTKKPETLLGTKGATAIDDSTIAYGVGCWHLINGDEAAARAIFDRIVAGETWAAFGYIAAEAELARAAR